MDDDPCSPYWPGDDAVDWVGLTLYHFGDVYPWGENEIPAPGKMAAKITGTYRTGFVDETAVPDFYATYAVGHAEPFAIPRRQPYTTRPGQTERQRWISNPPGGSSSSTPISRPGSPS